MSEAQTNRRPIKARSARWAKWAAAALARSNVTPNQISSASVVIASIGALILALSPNALGLLACAASVQARLACNLLDGMVAIEGGKKSALGALYNEFPDRIADSVYLVALGVAINWPLWGWLGAVAAVLTAYVRVFGGSLGLPQDFRGPMAKPHRMAVLTIGCLAGAVESLARGGHLILTAAAMVIALGSLATCVTRTLAITRALEAR